MTHVHGWVRCRYGVRRCAGPDCTAWLPPQPKREGAHGCLLPFGKPRRPRRAGKGAATTAAPDPTPARAVARVLIAESAADERNR